MRHMDAKVAGDRIIARVAESQHGVVGVRQLYCAGVSRDAIRRRVRAGRLHRVHRGVYAVGHRGISTSGRWMAAILACGRLSIASAESRSGVAGEETATRTDVNSRRTVLGHWGAALSHRSAAALWGLLPASAELVDVSVPGENGRARRQGICVHRSWTLLNTCVTLRAGIPVTTPARTISDLRRSARQHRPGSVSQEELRRAVRQANVLGLPVGDQFVQDRTRSDLERDFLRLCRRCGLPAPEVNVRVDRYLVDFLWRKRRLVVETDGYQYHRGRVAFEEDRERDLAMRVLGYEVVRFSYRQVVDDPELVSGFLEEVLRTAR